MTSSDFRQRAREALQGNWFVAVIAAFIASLLGGISSGGGFSLDFTITEDMTDAELEALMAQLGINEEILTTFLIIIGVFAVIGFVYSIICLIIGSGVSVGYAQLNLDLVDKGHTSVGTIFSRFDQWKTALVARILVGLRVMLWTLLFIIPGIIESYSYAMVSFVMADNPYMTAREAMAESKRLMKGNRWRLFCLSFSFFGWAMLSVLTLGIGSLWLTPYMQASFAAFYRQIKAEANCEV